MEELGVITKQVNSMVTVVKPNKANKVKMCIGPMD